MLVEVTFQLTKRCERVTLSGFVVGSSQYQVTLAFSFLGTEVMIGFLHIVGKRVWVLRRVHLCCQDITPVRCTPEVEYINTERYMGGINHVPSFEYGASLQFDMMYAIPRGSIDYRSGMHDGPSRRFKCLRQRV